MNAEDVDPGTITGKYSYEGKDYPLPHVYAFQPPGQVEVLWVFVTDAEVPAAAAKDHTELAKLVGAGDCRVFKLVVDPSEADSEWFNLALRTPNGLTSISGFGWRRQPVGRKRVAGKLRYISEARVYDSDYGPSRPDDIAWSLDLEFNAPVSGASGKMQTLTGAQAQQSPQADVFIAYEKALLVQGKDAAMDAARSHVAAQRLAAMKDSLKKIDAARFKDFQTHRRKIAPQGDARRRQIENVVVDGDIAVLRLRAEPIGREPALNRIAREFSIDMTDRAEPNSQWVVSLSEATDGWKIATRCDDRLGFLCPRCVGANVKRRPGVLPTGVWIGAFAGLFVWMGYFDTAAGGEPFTIGQIFMLCVVGIGAMMAIREFVFVKNRCKDCGHNWR